MILMKLLRIDSIEKIINVENVEFEESYINLMEIIIKKKIK